MRLLGCRRRCCVGVLLLLCLRLWVHDGLEEVTRHSRREVQALRRRHSDLPVVVLWVLIGGAVPNVVSLLPAPVARVSGRGRLAGRVALQPRVASGRSNGRVFGHVEVYAACHRSKTIAQTASRLHSASSSSSSHPRTTSPSLTRLRCKRHQPFVLLVGSGGGLLLLLLLLPGDARREYGSSEEVIISSASTRSRYACAASSAPRRGCRPCRRPLEMYVRLGGTAQTGRQEGRKGDDTQTVQRNPADIPIPHATNATASKAQ